MKYTFKEIESCNCCGSLTINNKILGQRLNQSQGLKPKKKCGITVSIVKCSQCYLIYSNPLPIPNDIQDHYGAPAEDYWKEEYFNWNENYFKFQIHKAKELIKSSNENLKSLDIGVGIGKAMLSMNFYGFDAYGIEPSVPFYNKAIDKMNISKDKLKLTSVEEASFENETFDFITFGAVFEHLYDPKLCLEKALNWLKPNGVLHMEVPSSKWLIPKFVNFYYRLIGTNYVTNLSPMHSPFHLYEFDLKSFELLGEKMGFEICYSRYDVGQVFFFPYFLKKFVYKYMRKTNKGMQLTVYLIKK